MTILPPADGRARHIGWQPRETSVRDTACPSVCAARFVRQKSLGQERKFHNLYPFGSDDCGRQSAIHLGGRADAVNRLSSLSYKLALYEGDDDDDDDDNRQSTRAKEEKQESCQLVSERERRQAR